MNAWVLATATATAPPAPPPIWVLPIIAATAAFFWVVHYRWKHGRHFMSRFTTAKHEQTKLAFYGPRALPNAITGTAGTALTATWIFGDLAHNDWSRLCFLALAVVCLATATWGVKEWHWPTKRRMPAWQRRLADSDKSRERPTRTPDSHP